ncbi:MAG TPA: hypothetical protein P5123_05435 [Spirochaetota bacterium]|nr:hypothetical protein [Spirochaetota bacterium]
MKHLLYLITITFLLSITHPISAQTDSIKDDSDFLFWINYGFGIHQNYGGIISKSDYCENETFGIAALASSTAYLPSVDMIFTIRALGTSNVFLDYTDDSEQCSDFGIMIGKIKKSRWTYVSFSTGLGYVYGGYSGKPKALLYEGEDNSDPEYEYNVTEYKTAGIPMQIELMLTPLNCFGFGIVVFANLNIERPFYGALFCIQSGRLF